WNARQDLRDATASLFEETISLDLPVRVFRMTHDPRDYNLRKRSGADLEHLRIQHGLHIFFKHRIASLVIDLHPATTSTRPGKFFRNPFEGDPGHIADDLGK